MYKDSYKNRKKYYVTLFVSIYVTIFTVLALLVWANWKYIKSVFQTQQPQLSTEQSQFNELFDNVGHLEALSKEYNKENYQLRTAAYVRSMKYYDDDGIWTTIDTLSSLNGFKSFVNQKQPKIENYFNGLAANEYSFTVPKTKQKVDFFHMFAVLNVTILSNGNENLADLSGWGGDICQLATDFKDTTLENEELYSAIKQNVNSNQSSFGAEDRNADIDAVNIYSLITSNKFYNSIYFASIMYYSDLTVDKQIDMFKSYLGIKDVDNSFAVTKLYRRLISNQNLSTMASSFGFVYPITGEENYEQLKTIYEVCIQVFVECLK